MIDQYLSSAEDKWKLQNGLVLMLPHGYEGQVAEHSSASKRYLQLLALSDNVWLIVQLPQICSTYSEGNW